MNNLNIQHYTGNGACSGLIQSKFNKDVYKVLVFTLLANGQDDLAFKLGFFFWYQNYNGTKEPTSDLDEASQEHDVEGARWQESGSKTANTKWIMRAWSLGSRWDKTYKKELDRTPRYWCDARGSVAFMQARLRFTADLSPMISGTLLFGTANLINEGNRLNKEFTKGYINFNRSGFERLGGEAKFNFANPRDSYFRINRPKCIFCK